MSAGGATLAPWEEAQQAGSSDATPPWEEAAKTAPAQRPPKAGSSDATPPWEEAAQAQPAAKPDAQTSTQPTKPQTWQERWQQARDRMTQMEPLGTRPGVLGAATTLASDFGAGLLTPILHPIQTVAGMGEPIVAGGVAPGGMYPTTAPTGRPADQAVNEAVQRQAQQSQAEQAAQMREHPAESAAMLAGALAPGLLTGGEAAESGPHPQFGVWTPRERAMLPKSVEPEYVGEPATPPQSAGIPDAEVSPWEEAARGHLPAKAGPTNDRTTPPPVNADTARTRVAPTQFNQPQPVPDRGVIVDQQGNALVSRPGLPPPGDTAGRKTPIIPSQPKPAPPVQTAPAPAPQLSSQATMVRPTVQASTVPEQVQSSAKDQQPALEKSVEQVASGVPGAELEGARVKTADSIANKEDRGKPVETTTDVLGARVSAPEESQPQLEAKIEQQLPIVSKDKIDSNGLQATQYGVKTGAPGEPNQVSELQVVTPEQATAMKATDDLYDQQKKALAAGDKAKADELAEKIKAEFDAAKQVTKGSRIQLADGRPGVVNYVDQQRSLARVTLDDGSKMPTVPLKALKPETKPPSGETQPEAKGDKWIGVDLDGTLAHYDGFKGKTDIGAPIPAMVERVRQWLKDGNNVKILTARVSDDAGGEAKKAIQDWTEQHLGQRLDVTDVKDSHMTHLYDDRAVPVERNTGKLLAQPQPENATISPVTPQQGAGDKSTQPKQETPAGAVTKVGKIPVLDGSLEDYRKDPDLLIDELEKQGLGDDPYRSAIGLRGIYKEELGKTPRRSWHSPDGEKQYRLNGTSTVGITGDYWAAPGDTLRGSIPRAIENVLRYGDADYVALIRGELDISYSNDSGEQVITKPEVLAYIRKESAKSDTSPAPAKGAESSPAPSTQASGPPGGVERRVGPQVTGPRERRVNRAERQRVDQMSPEEMRRTLLTSDKTGLPNKRAFDEAQAQNPAKMLAMSDADGLKAFNDRFGYAAGDELLRAKADALREAGLEAYHDKGDEFLYRGENQEDLRSKLDNARNILRERIFDGTEPNGETVQLQGVDFSYGTGPDLKAAESALKEHKSEREARGERARGELGPGVKVTRQNEVEGQTGKEPTAVAGSGGETEVANVESGNRGEPRAADETEGGREQTNAIRKPGPEGLLQRQPEEAGKAGRERGRVEPGEQGQEPAREGAAEKEPLGKPVGGQERQALKKGDRVVYEGKPAIVEDSYTLISHSLRQGVPSTERSAVDLKTEDGYKFDVDPKKITLAGTVKPKTPQIAPLAGSAPLGIAKSPEQGENVSRGERNAQPASLSETDRGRPAAQPGGEDRSGVERAPAGVLQKPEGEREAGERNQTDRSDVRGNAEPVSEQGLEPRPGKGSDTGIDRTPGGEIAREATKSLAKPKALNRDWYTHPENWKPPTGTVGRLDANLAAIRILRDLEKSPRKLTDAEKDSLANYVGWGALQHAFAPYGAPRDEVTRWSRANSELQKLLSPDELARAQESTKNAHYTSPELVRFMWDTMQRFGFKAGNVLEPAVGTGNFLGMMPKAIRSKVTAITNELDTVSHGITKLLYPEAANFNKDFADLILPDNDVDLAIGNPPFGGYKLYDPNYKKLNALVHDFFFVKSLDKVRPGGVLAFITSTGTLDKADPSIRNLLASKANFLGAIRLPSGAFKANAGTDVTTDLVFLQKRAPGEEAKHADDWLASTQTELPGKYGMEKLNVNEYFQQHPEMMLGKPTASTRMYGGVGFLLEPHEGKDIVELLKEAQKALPRGIFKSPIQEATGSSLATTAAEFAPENLKEGQYTVDAKGALKQRVQGKLVNPEAILDKAGSAVPAKVQRFKALVGVRDNLNQLLGSMMTEPDDETGNARVAELRGSLEKAYTKFVDKYGYLNSTANAAFRDDPHYPRLLALENWDKAARQGTPADIFRHRTIFPRAELQSLPKDPSEALQLILAERGFPDVQMMARLRDEPVADVVKTLGDHGLIYRNPSSGNYETRETYLSGYVRDKLRDAKRAVAQGMKEYAPNVEALQKVVPKDIEIGTDPANSVSVRLGSTWIPTDALEQFIKDVLKSRGSVKYALGNWSVNGVYRTAEVTNLYGTPQMSADDILQESLNQKQATVYDVDKDGKRTINRDYTVAAQAAQQKLREAFQKWAAESDWKPELQRLYNDAYNNLAQVEYDGSHLTFPGSNPSIKLAPHQVNAAWRILQDGRGLLAHEVGAGKTFEMVAAVMEGRRVGTFKKPMVTVPNHIVEQFRKEFLMLYPGANLLVPTEQDFDSKNRQRIMSRIATGDYDAVILPHSQFNLMDISPERQRVTIQKQKDELRETIESLKADKGEKRTIKQLETAMAKLDASLKKLADLKADKAIYFDDTGVDALFVDEAHLYKNLSFYTKMTRIAGLQQAKAKSALRLKMKTEYLQDRNNGRGVIFATGTPIQNTMAELYTMMKYIAPDVLEKAGIRFFDDWAANFGSVITAMELSADGRTYKARSKFAQFQNVPELMNMFRSFADIKTAQDLNLPTPELETGRPIVVSVPGSATLEEYVGQLMERAEKVKGGQVDPKQDNMLKITTDGRKAATDMRLIDPTQHDDPDSKINTVIEKIHQEWLDGKNTLTEGPTTQMAFLDLYRTVADEEGRERELVNLYTDMRKKLMARGIPSDEIAIIGDYDTRAKRQMLFNAMNKGEVRILFGSTQKMGAGTNAQRLLAALHHIDLTWRPGDLAQRNGRIMRQGNLNKTVRQYNYLTERSFDAYMAQTLQGKAEFIQQIMSGRSDQRVMSDVASEMVLSLEEMKIAASGNPDVKLQYDLQMQKAQLESLQRSFEAQRRNNQQQAQSEHSRVTRMQADLRTLEAAQKTVSGIQGTGEEKGLKIEVDGKTFTDRKALGEYLDVMQTPGGSFHMRWNGIGVRVEPGVNPFSKSAELIYQFEYSGEKHKAPSFEMTSLARSIESRQRNLPDDIEALKTQIPAAKQRASRLDELAEAKNFPEKDKLDKVEEDLKAVEKRLGIRPDTENAMAQAVTAEVASDPEEDLLTEPSEEDDEEPEEEDRQQIQKPDLGATFHSGFLDPELFKVLFPDIAQRVSDWATEKHTPGAEQRAMMRETRGERDRMLGIVAKKLEGPQRSWIFRSRDDSKAFFNAVESGQIDTLPSRDQALAKLFRGAFDQMRGELQDLNPNILADYIENYFPHIWQRPSMAAQTIRSIISGKRPFAGKGSFLKQRTIPTIQDGLDMGLTPVSWNPVDLFLRKYSEMGQFLMAQKTLKMMKEAGTVKMVRIGEKAPEGWQRLDDRIGQVHSYDDEGHLYIRANYFAPPDAAKVFNNYVSRGLAGRSGIYDTLRWVNNNLNSLQLGISAFHASTTAINAATSEVALGIQQLFEGKPFTAAGHFLSGGTIAPSVIRTMVNGSRMMREYLDPGSYKKMEAEASAVAEAGGRARMDMVQMKALDKTINAFRNGSIGEGLLSLPGTVLQTTIAPVMDWMVPRMKLGAFYDMAHDIFDQGGRNNWSEEQIRGKLQRAWDSIDNRFGQLVYENLFWHKGLQDTLMLASRSVGWNFGDLRELGGAAADVGKQAAKAATGKMPEVTPRMAFAFALPLVTGLVGAVLTYLWTGQKPDTWKDYFYPKRKDGTRVSIPGYMKDVIAIGKHPIDTIVGKMSPLLSLTAEAINNRDFYGAEIRHKDDPPVKQMIEVAKWAGAQAIPFSFSGTKKLLDKKGADTSTIGSTLKAAAENLGEVALGQLGFQPAPASIQNSAALNKAREYEQENRPSGTKTAEEAKRTQAMHTIEDMYHRGDVHKETIDAMKAQGVLREQDILRARLYSRTDPLTRAVRSLTGHPEQVLNVYKEADPGEQKLLRPLVEAESRKLQNMPLPAEQKDALRKAFRDALNPGLAQLRGKAS